MPEKQSTVLHTIRITTKERPSDRFLTAQLREGLAEGDERQEGDFYFLVEILNPWFPNSQIGQTIINTIVREYRRGESSSILTNLELALKKTNQVLAQITQNGETDWIGNLASIIVFHHDDHIYIAQTGRARAFLLRSGRLSEITEGLDEEASEHPLTTYTNITSGTFEPGDRIILGTSELTETLDTKTIKDTLALPEFDESGRELVRHLQKARQQRVAAFIFDWSTSTDQASIATTLYLDQSLNNPTESIGRFMNRTVKPGLSQTFVRVAEQSKAAFAWSRDWLVPTIIDYSKRGTRTIKSGSETLMARTQPLLKKVQPTSEILKRTNKEEQQEEAAFAQEDIAGQSIYRVHHYTEEQRAARRAGTDQVRGQLQQSWQNITSFIANLSKMATAKQNRSRVLILGLAFLVLLGVVWSITARHGAQTATQASSQANTALTDAQTAQQAAERAVVLGEKDTARTQYALAIEKAKQAAKNSTSEQAATAIITQSQGVLDQLTNTTRLAATTAPAASLSQPTLGLASVGTVLATVDTKNKTVVIVDPSTATVSSPIQLTKNAISPVSGASINSTWFLNTEANSLTAIDPQAATAQLATFTDNAWKNSAAVANYGTSLYAVDVTGGQILKFTQTKNQFDAGKGYLKSADTTTMANTISMTIDGNVYLLQKDGSVRKYTKGTLVNDWQLSGVEASGQNLITPSMIFAADGGDHIYLLDKGDSASSARVLAFDEKGTYTSQIALPSDWIVDGMSFDAKTKSGYILAGQKIYKINF